MASISMPYEGGVTVNKNSIKVTLYVDLEYDDEYRERFEDIKLLNSNASMSYTKSPSNNTATYYTITATITNFPKGQKFEPRFQLVYEYREKNISNTEYYVETVEDDGEYAYKADSKSEGRQLYLDLQDANYVQEIYPTEWEYEEQDTSSWVGNDYAEVISYRDIYLYVLEYDSWSDWLEDEVNLDAFSVYTHPSNFYFKGDGEAPAQGDSWNVEEGIKSLFTNYDNFNSAATAKINWKNQNTDEGTCTALSSTGNLTASDLTEAYNYLGIKYNNNWTKFNSGEIIKADMFSKLEDAINN